MLSPTITKDQRTQSARQRLRTASSQTRSDVGAFLDHCPGELDIASAEDLELFYLAALLLRSQGRVEEVLASGEFGLHRRELIWATLATHLKSAGYELGKRYMPGWTNCDRLPEGVRYMEYFKEHPEAQCLSFRSARAIHATHHSSGRQVVLKIVCTRPGILGDEELEILQYLNSPELRKWSANAAVDLLDVVDFPSVSVENDLAGDFRIVVMPALDRVVISDCVIMAYALDLMRQAFKPFFILVVSVTGSYTSIRIRAAPLIVISPHRRDIARRNLMVSHSPAGPLFLLRIIDFGQSFRIDFDDSDPLGLVARNTTRSPWVGGQIDVDPESYSDPDSVHNPFKAEIYALGRTWQFFLSKNQCRRS
ncbi:hypothetical protein EXIGLDRAFT_830491 [Exidia glandulosa HHB12029]|uniref:Protein kinase domain-containing protein n=1 Tax=Exidia glandulosa HHB12029 TaxID=1314781 RepID=A0A165NJZ5_EXIGL|nr:hypothetical protein EXIGLDRAFT_830491 [Exidia glandulosa HHB12029]